MIYIEESITIYACILNDSSIIQSLLDINECSNNNGGCSHFCHNTFGSYYCSCDNNEDLVVDNRTCEGIKSTNMIFAFIYYIQQI